MDNYCCLMVPAFYSLPIKYDEIISGKVVKEVDKILNHEGENIKEYEDKIVIILLLQFHN